MKYLLELIILAVFAVSCANDDTEETNEVIGSCLEDYITQPCELMELAVFANLAETNPADIEVEVPETIPLEEVTQYSRILCEYRWPSTRMSVITIVSGDTEIESQVPLDNVVSVGDIEVIQKDDLLTLGDHTETYREFFHRVRIGDDNPNSEPLEGIGDMASVQVIDAMNHSNYKICNIWVLHKNVNFNIAVDVSDSSEEDLELAKKIAQEVLSVCSM